MSRFIMIKREPEILRLRRYGAATRLGMNVIDDLNGDGIISDDDRYFAGSTLPIAYGGIAHEIKWKSFDLNLLLIIL